MSMKTKLSIPKKEVFNTMTLQARGVKVENVEFVKDQTAELGYATYGEYLNALLDVVRKDVRSSVQKKSRRRSQKAS